MSGFNILLFDNTKKAVTRAIVENTGNLAAGQAKDPLSSSVSGDKWVNIKIEVDFTSTPKAAKVYLDTTGNGGHYQLLKNSKTNSSAFVLDNDVNNTASVQIGQFGAAGTFWFDDLKLSYAEAGGCNSSGPNGAKQGYGTNASANNMELVTIGGTNPSPSRTEPWSGAFQVLYAPLCAGNSDHTLDMKLQIANLGAGDTPLADLKMRYWYSKEGSSAESKIWMIKLRL